MKLSRTLGFLVALAVLAFAPIAHAQSGAAMYSRVGGVFYAPAYANWQTQVKVASGSSASGAQTIVVGPAQVSLADGRNILPFNATNPAPITIGSGSDTETVTPSAISISSCPLGYAPAQYNCATITATFSNAHPAGESVSSGDNGMEEAINDAAATDGGLVYWEADTGPVTLNTGGLTTTTTTLIPTTFYNLGAAARVETTITTSANWKVGTAAGTGAFCASNSTLTAGTTCTPVATTVTGTGSTALTAILFTMGTSDPGAGVLKAKVWGYTPVQPLN